MINNEKIKELESKIKINRAKLSVEKDPKERESLRRKIRIDELKIEIERLK
jgi:hypothetical protein